MQVTCSLKVGLVQRLAATWRGGLHSSPRALVTTVGSTVVLRRVKNFGVIIIIIIIIIIISITAGFRDSVPKDHQ